MKPQTNLLLSLLKMANREDLEKSAGIRSGLVRMLGGQMPRQGGNLMRYLLGALGIGGLGAAAYLGTRPGSAERIGLGAGDETALQALLDKIKGLDIPGVREGGEWVTHG